MSAQRRLVLGAMRADWLSAALAIVVLAVGTAAFVVFTGSAAMVRRDFHDQLEATHQPDLVVEAEGPLGPDVLAAIEALSEVASTEPRLMLNGWVTDGSGTRRAFELIAVEDLEAWDLGRREVVVGSSRPGAGEILVDRSAIEALGMRVGDAATLEIAGGRSAAVRIVGLSRQPGRATWFEPPAFGVTTLDALRSIRLVEGPNAVAIDLAADARIVGPPGADPTLAAIVGELDAAGVRLRGVQLEPAAGSTSLDRTLDGIDIVLGTLGAMALVSGTFLVAGTIGRLLARQRRQIGILQALGAGRAHITRLHALLVAAHVVPGLAMGLVIGLAGARILSSFVTDLINVEARSWVPPPSVLAVQVAIGLTVPGMALLVAVWRAMAARAVDNLRELPSSPARMSRLVFLLELGARSALARIGRRNAVRDGASSVLIVAALGIGGGLLLAVISVGAAIGATPDVQQADLVGYRILAWLMGGVGAVIGVMGALALVASVAERASERRRELAVLVAVGAGPADTARVLLDEALGLSLLSWGGALALWPVLAHPLGQQLGETLTGVGVAPTFGLEGLVLGFAMLAFALVAAAVPVARVARTRPRDALARG